MENILEKLYDLHIKMEDCPYGKTNHEDESREWQLYHYLYQNFSLEDRKIFSEYINLNENRHKGELKSVYEYGFKTAIQLIVEALKD